MLEYGLGLIFLGQLSIQKKKEYSMQEKTLKNMYRKSRWIFLHIIFFLQNTINTLYIQPIV